MRTESVIIQATYEEIRRPSEVLRSLFRNIHISEEITNGCELALHELLTNLVDHSYEGDGRQTINVKVTYHPTWVLLETVDTGTPMQLGLHHVRMPDPTDLAEGGYGLAIIQSLMDEVRYRYENGRNIWQLVKYI
jgi:serine/threonine-protein kinase RsbW